MYAKMFLNQECIFKYIIDTINDYMLRKVVEDWCTKPGDGYLSFIFRPPWIHTRSSDSYYTLHPEERIFGSK